MWRVGFADRNIGLAFGQADILVRDLHVQLDLWIFCAEAREHRHQHRRSHVVDRRDAQHAGGTIVLAAERAFDLQYFGFHLAGSELELLACAGKLVARRLALDQARAELLF